MEDSKSPAMRQFLDRLTTEAFGRSRSEARESGTCVTCGKPATEFTDELSAKEFKISGMCQACQDSVF